MKKRCSNCKKTKDLNDFNKNRSKKDGRQYRCRECQKLYHNKDWYIKNKDKIIKSNYIKKKERRNQHWTKIIKRYFSKGCVDCGIKNVRVLEFDHVRGNKVNGVGTMVSENYGWKTIKKEIDKCEVRCRNCHMLRTFEQFNWHDGIDAFNIEIE